VKIAIGIGELSGDLIASGLIKHIQKNYPDTQIIGITGPNCQKIGLKSSFNISELSVRGFFEVIYNYKRLSRFRNNFLNYLYEQKPDIYLGIDAPDFNFYIEKRLKRLGIKTYHMVCPSIWAWRKSRYKNFKKTFDHLFCIFAHEVKFLKNLKVKNFSFVGHPLANTFPILPEKKTSRDKLKLKHNGKIIALLPGSRNSEVVWNTDILLKTVQILNKELPNLLFMIPVTTSKNLYYLKYKKHTLGIDNITLIHGHSHDILNVADISIVASGTATLEAVFLKKPMIIFYKLSSISYLLFKALLKSKFIGLPNILANKLVSPEFVHKKASAEVISSKVLEMLNDSKYLKNIKTEFTKIHKAHKLDTNELICKKFFK
jgi:lipid-A-disaccharide synthase